MGCAKNQNSSFRKFTERNLNKFVRKHLKTVGKLIAVLLRPSIDSSWRSHMVELLEIFPESWYKINKHSVEGQVRLE